jgi:hypothetical protein
MQLRVSGQSDVSSSDSDDDSDDTEDDEAVEGVLSACGSFSTASTAIRELLSSKSKVFFGVFAENSLMPSVVTIFRNGRTITCSKHSQAKCECRDLLLSSYDMPPSALLDGGGAVGGTSSVEFREVVLHRSISRALSFRPIPFRPQAMCASPTIADLKNCPEELRADVLDVRLVHSVACVCTESLIVHSVVRCSAFVPAVVLVMLNFADAGLCAINVRRSGHQATFVFQVELLQSTLLKAQCLASLFMSENAAMLRAMKFCLMMEVLTIF